MDEVDWIDEMENNLGVVTREEAHNNGLLHRIATVYVGNDKGEILVQVRRVGGLDHSSAGHVDVGESYEEAAKRELAEELGIHGVTLKEIGEVISDEPYKNSHLRHKFKIYFTIAEPGVLNAEEVEKVYWQDPSEILKDMKADPDKYAKGFHATLPVFVSSKIT